jgi:hypothetical protein
MTKEQTVDEYAAEMKEFMELIEPMPPHVKKALAIFLEWMNEQR